MKLRIRGVYAAHRKLASGRRVTYYYHRKTGARLPDDPNSSAFLQAVAELNKPRKPALPEKSFKHLFQRYRASTAYTELGKRTKQEYDRHIRYVEPVIGLFQVASFTRDHMDRITSNFAEKPALANAIRRTISVLLGFAADVLQWIPVNPILGMEKRRRRREEGQRPLTEPEIARFRAANPYGSRERLAFELGLATALRREDMVKVRGEDILAGLIPLLTNKAGVLVVAPVMRHLLDAYHAFRKQHPKHAGSIYALGAHRDGIPIHKRTLSESSQKACDRAGFDAGQRLHALRYTAAARLFECDLSFNDIAEHTGHRMAAMAQKYCEKRRNAMERGQLLESYDDIATSCDVDERQGSGSKISNPEPRSTAGQRTFPSSPPDSDRAHFTRGASGV